MSDDLTAHDLSTYRGIVRLGAPLSAKASARVLDRIDADARRIEACDAEMDRLNSALVDAWADVAKLRGALRRLRDNRTLSLPLARGMAANILADTEENGS